MANIETLLATTRYYAETSAPSTPAAGGYVTYVKTDGKLYGKNDAGTEIEFGSAGGASNLIHTAITRQNIGSNLTFSSTTHTPVDNTNLTITETFRAGVVLLNFTCRWSHSSATGTGAFSFDVDGTVIGGGTSVDGLYIARVVTSGTSTPCILTYLTSLSAGSHTIKPTVKTSGATLTAHQSASTDIISFSVTELYAV